MRFPLFTSLLVVAPAIVAAQQAETKNPAEMPPLAEQSQGRSDSSVLAQIAPENRVKLQVTLEAARRRNLPTRPMIDRIAASKAKGSTDPQIVTGTNEMLNRLELSQQALAKAGRRQPDPHEVALGAVALERGVSPVQLEALIKSAPTDRSLVISLDVLTQLTGRGLSAGDAIAQVSGKLAARAPDSEIAALTAGLGAGVKKP